MMTALDSGTTGCMTRRNAAPTLPAGERLYVCPELAERLEALVQATGNVGPEVGDKPKGKAQPPPLGDFGKTIYVWRALDQETSQAGVGQGR